MQKRHNNQFVISAIKPVQKTMSDEAKKKQKKEKKKLLIFYICKKK